MRNVLGEALRKISYSTCFSSFCMQQKPISTLNFPFVINIKFIRPVTLSLFLLPWQTKPFECAGRVAVNNLQCETKLMAGDTGGRCIRRIRQESFYQLEMLYDDQDRMTV